MLFYYTPRFPKNGKKDRKVHWAGDLDHRDASAVLLRGAVADSGRYKCEVLGRTGTVLVVNVHVKVEPRPTDAAAAATDGGVGVSGVGVGGVGVGGGGEVTASGAGGSSPTDAPNNTKETSRHEWWVALVCILILHIVASLLLFSYMLRKGFKFEKKSGSRRSTHVETQLVNSEEFVGEPTEQQNSPTYVNVYEDMRHGPQGNNSNFDNNTYNENVYVIADSVDDSEAAAGTGATGATGATGPTSRPAPAVSAVGGPDFEPAPKPTSVYEDMRRTESCGMLVMVDNPTADDQLCI
ncbi:uncharacterized protein LOC142907234 [Petromyzon marinus]|uniref:uncharacterized protein LOC142907234 n=1 Tax=Petromyzon marinus TaxID=7757 RepID=UPI003F6E56BB